MEPVIEAPGKSIDAVLLVGLGKSFKPDFLVVRLVVSGSVLRVNNIRRSCDENTFIPGFDSGGKIETTEEESGCLVFSVSIPIFQKSNTTARRSFGIDAQSKLRLFSGEGPDLKAKVRPDAAASRESTTVHPKPKPKWDLHW